MRSIAGSLAGMSKGPQVDPSGVSEVAYMAVPSDVEAQRFTPIQAMGHVIGLRREATDAVVNSIAYKWLPPSFKV